ncbi:MAG: electron transport complex protein RnfD [Granulosicoccus sp.]|jgi:electron transport complex protein RnfD
MLWLVPDKEERNPRMISNIQGISFLARRKRSVRTVMLHVMVALAPGTLLYTLLLDVRILANLAIASIVALCCEYVCLRLRKKPVLASLSDGSILLAAWLLVLCLPPSLPTWQIIVGAFVLVTLGKHVFGGLGQNPFNPAMVAYAFLLVSFPVTMTSWELNQAVSIVRTTSGLIETSVSSDLINNFTTSLNDWDGVTGATALDRLKELKRSSPLTDKTNQTSQSEEISLPDAKNTLRIRYELASDWILNSPWTWTSIAWLLGGLYMLMTRIITWHIPTSVLVAISSYYAIAHLTGSGMGLPIVPALLSGGIILGAFFIATDPVSAAASRQGQIIYGFGIGILVVVIREFSVYPEGVAFAVLLMNMCVPLIDYLSTGKQGTLTSRSRPK